MRIAILGAGAIGFGTAAFLARRGHDVVLWSPSGARTAALSAGAPLVASGAVSGTVAVRAAPRCGDAVADAAVVIIAVPGYAHRAVIDAACAVLSPGQLVIFSSHASLSALYLAKRLAARGIAVPVAAWGTTLVTARQTGPAEVRVSNVRDRVDMAALPVAAAIELTELCRGLFGERFVLRADLLAVSLSNLNPQNHLGMALCNWTRIERGEAWGNYGGITDGVGRLIEALDRERLAVAAALGVEVRTVHDHFHQSFQVERAPLGVMARAVAAAGDPPGPTSADTRYVTEDVPYGLVPTTELARLAGVPTPLHDAGIEMFSAIAGRDFRRENDILPALNLGALGLPELRRRARDGWPS